MAMKSMIKIKAEPAWPNKWSATAGGTNPEPASLELIGSMSAVDASPKEVAREKGIANQQIPPSKYPLAALAGRAAMADCQ